jgi:peptide/nickel transport system substrate-binding protein
MHISDPVGPRRLLAAGVTVVTLVATAGCGMFGQESQGSPEPARGGTLHVILQAPLDNLDPQRNQAAIGADVLRLTTRTLTTYRSAPGPAASEIVPDLATDTGRPSDGNRVWSFTLKPGMKWESGEPIVCSQVKYGIERHYSTLVNDGPRYPDTYLADNPTAYEGPWVGDNNGGRGLESIMCEDERNITFRLKRPVGDFGYTVALSVFAPVLPEKDAKVDYSRRPYSNGPYKIESRDDKQLTLIRNKFWSDANDQVRKAYPDKIVFEYRADDGGVVTNEMIEDQGASRDSVMLDANVAPNFLQQVVNDSNLIGRAITGSTGATRFLAINTKLIPNLACRQALIYAFNMRKYRTVNGGAVLGEYASTIIPPSVKAHKPFDLYGTLANPEGNPARAMSLMEQQRGSEQACPDVVKLAFPDTSLRRRLANTIVEAYQLAGIQVELKPIPPGGYYGAKGIGDIAAGYHLMLVGWVPDWASGSAIIPPLFDGKAIQPDPITGHTSQNINWSQLNDPKINDGIDGALNETDPARQYAVWGDLDQQIQQLAVTIPILYEKGIRLAGSNVAGGFIHPAFGLPDLCSLGLATVTSG